MQHTLIAVFDNRSDAQKAMDELLQCGFARDEVRLTEDTGASVGGQSSAAADTQDEGVTAKVKHFFTDLFGTDNSAHSEKYATAVTQGHHVLTVTAEDEPEIERAADVVERYGPVDIDEKSALWAGGAGVARSEAMRMSGAGGMQQSQGASLQSHGDRNLLQQQSLNNDVPRGTTYQEPMEDSFTVNTPTAASRQGGSMQDSQQRDTSMGVVTGGTGSSTSSTAIPVVQEQLKVGKREVQRGGVRVFSRIVETPVDQSIGLREEHVNIERHAVDQPVSPADATAFREQTIELRETAEEAVVEKTARVVEEVVVAKEVSEREEEIHGTVRHTEVEVEKVGAMSAKSSLDDDESYYRAHFDSTYGSSGGAYDEYAPAYGYGREMANMYKGRPWNEVESDVRTRWEQRDKSGAASTWEKFKAAIRHGWERITS
jgi:uncharacterized protein (TIGR02271 family)